MNHKRYYMVQIRYHMVPVRRHRVQVVNDNVDTNFSRISLCKKVPLSFHTIRPVSFPGTIFLYVLSIHPPHPNLALWWYFQWRPVPSRESPSSGTRRQREEQSSFTSWNPDQEMWGNGRETDMCLVLVLLAAPASSLPPFGGSGSR